MTQGIVYIVYGDSKHFTSLEGSIKQLKKVCNLPITVLSSKYINIPGVDVIKIREQEDLRTGNFEKCFKTKLLAKETLPYYTNILVDAETFFLEDPAQLISLDYDIGGCRETAWCNRYIMDNPHVPGFHAVYNSGFLIVHNNSRWKQVYKRACELYSLAEQELLDPPATDPCPAESLNQITEQWAINYSILCDFDITTKTFPGRWNVRQPNIDVATLPAMIHSPLYIRKQYERSI